MQCTPVAVDTDSAEVSRFESHQVHCRQHDDAVREALFRRDWGLAQGNEQLGAVGYAKTGTGIPARTG
jgi:hypothetical protein